MSPLNMIIMSCVFGVAYLCFFSFFFNYFFIEVLYTRSPYDNEYEVGLIFIISLHKFLVEKYVKIHKIDRCYLF